MGGWITDRSVMTPPNDLMFNGWSSPISPVPNTGRPWAQGLTSLEIRSKQLTIEPSFIKYSHSYMFQPYAVIIRLTFKTYYDKYTNCTVEVRSHFHTATCVLLTMCSKSQTDNDPIGTKHVALWIIYSVAFDGYFVYSSFYISTQRDAEF